MLHEIVRWFSGKDARTQPRKKVRFPVYWIAEDKKARPGTGAEISAAGLLFALKEPARGNELNIVIDLPTRRVAARVNVVHQETEKVAEGARYWIGCSFAGISADDWDAIVRFVDDQPEVGNKAADELQELTGRDDNAYRLLPLVVQRQIVATLVQMRRLTEPADGAPPLLKLHYIGARERADGKKSHKVSVHSRVHDGDGVVAFDTQFTIEDDGSVRVG